MCIVRCCCFNFFWIAIANALALNASHREIVEKNDRRIYMLNAYHGIIIEKEKKKNWRTKAWKNEQMNELKRIVANICCWARRVYLEVLLQLSVYVYIEISFIVFAHICRSFWHKKPLLKCSISHTADIICGVNFIFCHSLSLFPFFNTNNQYIFDDSFGITMWIGDS